MAEADKFDVIVVGAGVAGSACAYTLAKAGKSVLLIERGVDAGSKNVSGGRIYTYALEMLEPGLTAEAADVLERCVTREQIVMLQEESAMTVEYFDKKFAGPVPQSYTVLRAKFDAWLAAKAEAEGAILATGIQVDNVLEKDGRIVGIIADQDEIYADIVVAADGVNTFLAQKAGLCPDITSHTVNVGVKEIIQMPKDLLETRFRLTEQEGAAQLILGCTDGIPGGGFLYTNQDSVSLGMVVNPELLGKQEKRLHEIFQDFKTHPAIYPLIAEGTTIEYGAHLVPEGGLRAIPKKIHRDGFLVIGDAAGFVINAGIILRGMDLAMVSGIAAARAIVEANEPVEAGSLYSRNLDNLNLIPSMAVFKGWPDILAMPRMFTKYPKLANDMMEYLFTVNGNVPKKMHKGMFDVMKQNVSVGELLADAWKGVRSL
ncbi:MAG: FAD-dependent oxidoreductase [Negativicutes bacterium]|nr:FAD-dependent oxidoreductase [Negativicutes bacterium]